MRPKRRFNYYMGSIFVDVRCGGVPWVSLGVLERLRYEFEDIQVVVA